MSDLWLVVMLTLTAFGEFPFLQWVLVLVALAGLSRAVSLTIAELRK